jgi:hypothetical protein
VTVGRRLLALLEDELVFKGEGMLGAQIRMSQAENREKSSPIKATYLIPYLLGSLRLVFLL